MNAPDPEPVYGAEVPGLAATRMLRSLWRTGWTNDTLAPRVGLPVAVLDAVLDGGFYLLELNASRIAQVWAELREIPGTSWRAIAQAEKLGWPPAYELQEEAAGLADCPLLRKYPRMDATRAEGAAASRTGGKNAYPGAVQLRRRIAERPDRRYPAPRG